jgi:hypothetical protein
VRQLSFQPAVYLLEMRIAVRAEPFAIQFSSAAEGAERLDAASSWNSVIDDMRRHPSQFDGRWIAAIVDVPQQDRAVFIARAGDVLSSTCP